MNITMKTFGIMMMMFTTILTLEDDGDDPDHIDDLGGVMIFILNHTRDCHHYAVEELEDIFAGTPKLYHR